MNIDDAYDHCRAITHKHGGNFSVGFRFLPERAMLDLAGWPEEDIFAH